ncbi:MAG: hypothetical protein SH857_01005 [Chitinophagales bacterium]|nr:hypothetical protein [Chitinophagales bacterium]
MRGEYFFERGKSRKIKPTAFEKQPTMDWWIEGRKTMSLLEARALMITELYGCFGRWERKTVKFQCKTAKSRHTPTNPKRKPTNAGNTPTNPKRKTVKSGRTPVKSGRITA